MSSLLPLCRGIKGNRLAGLLGAAGAAFLPVFAVSADDNIFDYVVTEGTQIVVSGTDTVVALDASGGTYPIRGEIAVTSTDFSTYYELSITASGVNGAAPYQSGVSTPALLQFSNNAGSVSGTGVGEIHFWNAAGAYPDQIGNGALRLIGAPAYYSTGSSNTQYFGGDVSWTQTGAITVEGSGALLSSGPLYAENGFIHSGSLSPGGFRAAQLSGIVAFSYGDQATGHSHTWPGGNVSVTSSGVITMSNADSTQTTAGISAGTAAGPASHNPDFPDPVKPPPTVTVTLDGGSIANSADAGFGVLATATGAQFLHDQNGDGDVAYGGDVTVSLLGSAGSSITMTGSTGVGVFAVSEVYTVSDVPKNSTVQAGVVTVNNGTTGVTGSSISAGTEDSLFSIGIMAVSAGKDLYLSPSSSQEVNGHGVGNGGAVIVNNFGSVTTAGKLSAGIVGLSVGGAGIVTTNSGTEANTVLGNSGGAETNGQGDAVTIRNEGVVSTVGANAYGVVALSSGGGGLLNNDIEAVADSNGIATGGLVVGNNTSTSSGSHASTGGAIFVTNSGTIATGDGAGTGVASMGIVAQSIGGAGGSAGGNHAALFVGDKGGQGGAGGAATVTLGAGSLLETLDENSTGVLVQSVGGGGGNGANAKGLFVAVGGKGGAGGDGGAITVDVSGALNTRDDYSAGVIAQSIGGGGGHGGTATAVGLGAAFGIGGNGGSGGIGGTVTGTVAGGGAISTVGNNATAFHLQSIGGGGGTGGAAIAESVGAGTGEDVTIDFNMALGGSGGDGGEGGGVSGVNLGVISTGLVATGSSNGAPNMDGADSFGMMAQSIGGGGGQGGLATAKSLVLNLSGTESGAEDAETDPGPVSDTTNLVISIGANVSDSGSGGKGNDGGAASLENSGSVTTWGDGSIAMIAQSVGGGGGSGGDSTAAAALSAATGKSLGVNVSLGGGGGNGGSGNSVSLTNSGASSVIATHGQNAAGMVGQSIGGGGGNATIGNSGTANLHTPVTGSNSADAVAIAFTLGGSGGKGGNAGYTGMSNGGVISTAGSGAQGILAQAIGGGGGNASGGAADGSNNRFTIDLGIGGSGGDGGSASGTNALGQSVTVANSGTIFTLGGDAAGIVAQSIGGGGGTGGSADAMASVGTISSLTNLIFSGTNYQSNITVGAAVGGSGGKGGQGGNVEVDQNGVLSTQGFQSHGILAQSISGGGGKGGAATAGANPGLFDVYDGVVQFGAVVAVGGKGGDAHDGGMVLVNAAGETSTAGYGAHGVLAQSVGGGGGMGADGTADITSSIGLGIAVSQSSGTMGNGGAVTVNQTFTITTFGGDASGIVAQSISGGGGLASTGSERHLLQPSMGAGILPVHLDFTLGVNVPSSEGSDGGSVTVASGAVGTPSLSQITTQGDFSHGVVAQSVGAGGGKASSIFGTDSGAYADFSQTITREVSGTMVTSREGINLGALNGHGAGGTVNVSLEGTSISTGASGTAGYGAYGVLAQSIGGGGGLATVDTAAASGNIGLGGESSAVGNGGSVNLEGAGGWVSTQGETAHGIVLQSIGGGGGAANVGSSRTFSGSTPSLPVTTSLGGRDSSGTGGAVNLNAQVAIATMGDQAFGLVAQSIGGGGGIATGKGSSYSYLGAIEATHGATATGGGTVTVDLLGESSITTGGRGAHGIVAQSIGGGGGIATPTTEGALTTQSDFVNASVALGYGGATTLNISGHISTTGAGANGVVAQVLSGGGGLSGNFAGVTGTTGSTGSTNTGTNAGSLSVFLGASGTVSASGAGAAGLFAQNVTAGEFGAGEIALEVAGAVTGGSGLGAHGIWVVGGNGNNKLTIDSTGAVSAVNATGLSAIHYTGSADLEVSNSGTVKGSVSLSEGALTGYFTNNQSGVFMAEGDIFANVINNGHFVVGVDDSAGGIATLHGGFQSTEETDLPMILLDVFTTSDYDQIMFSASGSGEFTGGLAVDFSDSYQARVNDQFLLVGAGAGQANDYNFSQWMVNLDPSITYEFTTPGDTLVLTITGVPEPATGMFLLLGAGLLLARRSRRMVS